MTEKTNVERQQCSRMRSAVTAAMSERKLTRAKIVRHMGVSRTDFDSNWQTTEVTDRVVTFWSNLLDLDPRTLYEAAIFSE